MMLLIRRIDTTIMASLIVGHFLQDDIIVGMSLVISKSQPYFSYSSSLVSTALVWFLERDFRRQGFF